MIDDDVLLETHHRWMRMALREATTAFEAGEVPVGAVIVRGNTLLGRGHNNTEGLVDPTAHAEILAIGAAAESLGEWRLDGATLYATLEPCAMCAGAAVLSRLERVVFGAADPKAGACGSLRSIVRDRRLNHRLEVVNGVLATECSLILKKFFAQRRTAS